ncbi:MAG TPA: hypothetical protein VJ962_00790 [Clostridia bacterium]|nr:hypothetical protein [Clostridia bacterium]
MKTKNIFYIVSVFLIFVFTSCEDEHEMTKYSDTVSFVEESYFITAKEDFSFIQIPVTHRSINTTGSQAEIEIVAEEGSPANVISLDKNVVNFDEADTVMIKLTLDYNSLIEDEVFTYKLKFTDKYLEYGYGGYEEVTVEVTKWRPRVMSDFVGTYNAYAVSNVSPGEYDEEWPSITTVADETDDTKLLITGIAGSTIAVEAYLDFEALTITIPAGQLIGDVYGYGDTYIYNSSDGSDVTVDDLVGTLYENNNFSFDYMALYLFGYQAYWDIFTPTFTKQ